MSLKALRQFASLLLLLSLCLGVLPGGGPAALTASAKGGKPKRDRKDKVGSDLRKKVRESAGSERVKVIVSPSGSWSGSLESDLRNSGAVVEPPLKNLPVRAVEMSAKHVEAAAARGDVDQITLDRELERLGHVSLTTGADAARDLGSPAYDGSGVGIAVLDSGIDPGHVALNGPDAKTRVAYSRDFTGEGRTDDPNGHGTHVASLAAGNGNVAEGAYRGLAPNAKIINLRVLDSQGRGRVTKLLKALDWVLTNHADPRYNIKVVNMSLGTSTTDSYRNDPLCLAARRLVDKGIVVVAAAGNEGRDGAGNKIYGQIHSPGIDPSVITVGASNTFGTDGRADDAVASYSSRGPTRGFETDGAGVRHYDNLVKPDLVAPGNKIIAAKSNGNQLSAANPALLAEVSNNSSRGQMYLSGTSVATPVVAGAAALLLQANPKLTPNLVKTLFMYTAQPLANYNQFEQGAGQLNVEGAVRLAKLVRGNLSTATAVGAPLLTTPTPPAPQTTIAGQQFAWAQGLIVGHTFATGVNLITEFQKVYGLGTLLSDATVEAGGVMMSDGTLMSDGITLSENILTSTGVTLSEGGIFLGTSVLLGDGVMMSDGVMLADGRLVGDAVLLADGVLAGDVAMQARKARIHGDNSGCMKVVIDGTPDGLSATAVSKTGVELSWRDGTDNETGFRVERSANGGKFKQIAKVGAGATAFSDTGLNGDTAYSYRVFALNNSGTSRYSNKANVKTPKN